MRFGIRKLGLLYGVCAFAALLSGSAKQAVAGGNQKFALGEVLVYCQPGTAPADVQSLATIVGATKIVPNEMQDVYDLILPAASANQASTLSAVAQLKGKPNVKWVGVNLYYDVHQSKLTPNDPLFAQMHPLPQINMPQAWALQKGASNVEVADIDTGFDPNHEDLKGRYDLLNSYNQADGNTNITAPKTYDHGVSTSGIMVANTNNSIGVSGICWQNVLCVAEKCTSDTATAELLSGAAILASYADILKKATKNNIVAINMSYGAQGVDLTDTTNPEYVALLALSKAGIILCASSGNSSGDVRALGGTPAGYPMVLSISAVNRNGQLTYYSNYGKVELAAPGGEQYSDTDPNGYMICKLGSGYAFEQGTSFACPTVVGVFGLLMSVPNVTPAKAISVMESTANHSGLSTLPDVKFGYGIIDAYAALAQVSATTGIVSPQGIDPTTGQTSTGAATIAPVETQKPLLSFRASNISTDNETFIVDPGPGQVSFTATQLIQNVTATGTSGTSYGATSSIANVSDVTLVGTTTGTNPQYTISFRYAFPIGSSGSHTIQVSGINTANSTTITDTRTFVLSPYSIPVDTSGVSLVSFPYYESSEDLVSASAAHRGALLPSTVNLYRWFNVPKVVNGATVLGGTYAIYGPAHTSADPGSSNPNDALSPSLYVPTFDPASSGSAAPLGTAYFIANSTPIPYNSYGTDLGTTSFRIPLHQGWNMVGDPYNFAVGFNSLEIEQLSGARLTIQAAVDQNILLPHVYHYQNGDYTFDSLPQGNLLPWQGQWIYVLPPGGGTTLSDGVAAYLVVLPSAIPNTTKAATVLGNQLQRAVANLPAVSGPGSWALQVSAQSGQLHDNYNYAGMSSRATVGFDATKVPKPPKVGNFVSVTLNHAGLNSEQLAQDLLPVGGSRTWNLSVTTNQSRAPINLSWPNINSVPRNYKLVLTDTATGQSVDLRSESSYQFTSAPGVSSRAFTLSASPLANRGRALVSNITVNPGKSGGRAAGVTEISYTISTDSRVDVSVLGLNGRVIAQVSPSRAVTSGSNTVVWTGQDVNGHQVPGGPYVLQIRSMGSDGELTRQIVPFTVTGR